MRNMHAIHLILMVPLMLMTTESSDVGCVWYPAQPIALVCLLACCVDGHCNSHCCLAWIVCLLAFYRDSQHHCHLALACYMDGQQHGCLALAWITPTILAVLHGKM